MNNAVALDALLDEVRQRTGLVFPAVRMPELHAAITRHMRENGFEAVVPYAAAVRRDARLHDGLLTALTVGESFFFREPGQLDYIGREVLPAIVRRRYGRVGIWSAGCALGEEAYTLAIVAQQAGAASEPRVLATDLSGPRLSRARRGRYRRWSFRGVGRDIVERHFCALGEEFEIRKEIRDLVEFRQHNLLEPLRGVAPLDLILCRNVLIYFDQPAIELAARNLFDVLAPGGWLFPGAADPPLSDYVPLNIVLTGAGIAYRRPLRDSAATPVKRVRSPAGNVWQADRHMNPRVVPSYPAASTSPPPVAARATTITPPSVPDVPLPCTPDTTAREADVEEALNAVWKLADQGYERQAESSCADALDRWGPRADLLGARALLLTSMGRHEEGRVDARSALYLDPGLVVAHLALGEGFAIEGNVVAARRALRNAERVLATRNAGERVAGSRGDTVAELLALTRLRLDVLGSA